jgi:hypothetical protein
MKIRHVSNITAGIALTALLVIASPVSVLARQGADDPSDNAPQTQRTASDKSTQTTNPTLPSRISSPEQHTAVRATDSELETEDQPTDDSIHNRALKLLEQKRQNGKGHTQEQRQAACKQHEADIDQHFQVLGDKAGRYLNGFNTVFTKLQAYQTKKQLDVANYDTLVAAATAKQLVATAAVNALAAQSGSKVDCTASDPAQSVANVKTATQDAHTALQAYRSSLKTLAQALLDAKKASHTSSDSTGGNP